MEFAILFSKDSKIWFCALSFCFHRGVSTPKILTFYSFIFAYVGCKGAAFSPTFSSVKVVDLVTGMSHYKEPSM